MTKKKPELLAPAGTLAMLDAALAFGADAVYGGQPRYSLRVRNNDFAHLSTLEAGIVRAHALGRRFYLVANIYPHEAKLKTFLRDMTPVMALQPDALIMSDPGLMLLVREHWPEAEIHLSVQSNTVNSAAVRFWARNGVRRVILSRELSLDQISDIREACPDVELEVFVHGALCIAYSGRCLLSGYFNHRDANQGTCTNACRWNYKVHPAQTAPDGDVHLLEERVRAGEFMPIEEDEHGTYILNSRDLRAIEHVARLVGIGVDSLKIEGRTKSPYYAARACQAYRHAIDAAASGEKLDAAWVESLNGLANRGYTSGFLQRHPDVSMQNYEQGSSLSVRSQYVGDVLQFDANRGQVEVLSRNRFALGDTLEILHPSGNRNWQVSAIENAKGEKMDGVPGSDYRVWLPLPADTVGAFLARYLRDT